MHDHANAATPRSALGAAGRRVRAWSAALVAASLASHALGAEPCAPRWAALGEEATPRINGSVYALAVYDEGDGPSLFVGGDFTIPGVPGASHIARWDGASWSAVLGPGGGALNAPVRALAVYDEGAGPSLFAGGDFGLADGLTAFAIARWDGGKWTTLTDADGDIGVTGVVLALRVFDDRSGAGPALYVAGLLSSAGGRPAGNIARWNGASWTTLAGPMGEGVNSTARAMVEYDDGSRPVLYVGGNFSQAGGRPISHLARWDGVDWSPVVGPGGAGLNNVVNALAVFDPGDGASLYAAGAFVLADSHVVNRIARWKDADWAPLAGPTVAGVVGGVVFALDVFDDRSGAGPALYAGGNFAGAGGRTVNRVARWDGADWSPLEGPSGVGVSQAASGSPTVRAFAQFDHPGASGLYAGGGFLNAGGLAAHNVARWSGGPANPDCPGDVNADGVVDMADLEALLVAFGQPGIGLPADLNCDGSVGFDDLAVVLGAFGAACP